MRACVSQEEISRIGFYQPDTFIAHLQRLTLEDTPTASGAIPSESKVGKYKIKRSAVTLTAEELKERETSALGMLTNAMRRKT